MSASGANADLDESEWERRERDFARWAGKSISIHVPREPGRGPPHAGVDSDPRPGRSRHSTATRRRGRESRDTASMILWALSVAIPVVGIAAVLCTPRSWLCPFPHAQAGDPDEVAEGYRQKAPVLPLMDVDGLRCRMDSLAEQLAGHGLARFRDDEKLPWYLPRLDQAHRASACLGDLHDLETAAARNISSLQQRRDVLQMQYRYARSMADGEDPHLRQPSSSTDGLGTAASIAIHLTSPGLWTSWRYWAHLGVVHIVAPVLRLGGGASCRDAGRDYAGTIQDRLRSVQVETFRTADLVQEEAALLLDELDRIMAQICTFFEILVGQSSKHYVLQDKAQRAPRRQGGQQRQQQPSRHVEEEEEEEEEEEKGGHLRNPGGQDAGAGGELRETVSALLEHPATAAYNDACATHRNLCDAIRGRHLKDCQVAFKQAQELVTDSSQQRRKTIAEEPGELDSWRWCAGHPDGGAVKILTQLGQNMARGNDS